MQPPVITMTYDRGTRSYTASATSPNHKEEKAVSLKEAEPVKTCALCAADISLRNANALYCYACSLKQSKAAHLRARQKAGKRYHWRQYYVASTRRKMGP